MASISWLFNTVHILEFVLDLATVKSPLRGMSSGISVCIRSVCTLTMQTIWNFQHIVLYKKLKIDAVSLLYF
jgi:hypothetical protein